MISEGTWRAMGGYVAEDRTQCGSPWIRGGALFVGENTKALNMVDLQQPHEMEAQMEMAQSWKCVG